MRTERMMEKFFKVAAYLYTLVLVMLTVVPAGQRPVSGLQHHLEHFIALGPAGLLFGLAYGRRFRWLYAGAIALTLALESSQIPLPTRHVRLQDFIVDALAVCFGLALAQGFRMKRDDLATGNSGRPVPGREPS
jgi:hypothetical protein